jgi:hypothetical protein
MQNDVLQKKKEVISTILQIVDYPSYLGMKTGAVKMRWGKGRTTYLKAGRRLLASRRRGIEERRGATRLLDSWVRVEEG